MALTPTEDAILDLLDQGMNERAIVARGFSPAKVRFVVSTFGSAARNKASDERRRAAIRRGSAALAGAILQARS